MSGREMGRDAQDCQERLAQALERGANNGTLLMPRNDLLDAAAELRRLSADVRMLDWIACNPGFSSCVVIDAPHDGEYMVRNEWAGLGRRKPTVTYGKTFREALAQAMKDTP